MRAWLVVPVVAALGGSLPACAADDTTEGALPTSSDAAADAIPADAIADATEGDDAATDATADVAVDAPSDATFDAEDAAVDASPDASADAGFSGTAHVHVFISNTCDVSTSPSSFDVPAGKTLKISWHNHSVDYEADVWASYGGGYLELARGGTWNEPYEHCFIKSTHLEWVDVSPAGSPSACGKVRVNIQCHAP